MGLYTEGVSDERLADIRINECDDPSPGLKRARFRRLWNEIVKLQRNLDAFTVDRK